MNRLPLLPFALHLESYVRDSVDLISQLEELDIPEDFLDLKLSLETSRIVTDLFRKPTSTNSFLHYSSFHPQHLRNGIPKGQFLRLRRNCSNDVDFHAQSQELTRRFQARGYPKKKPRGYFNCRTKNLIYGLICSCPKIYVGQTGQELRRRIQQHISTINTAKTDLEKGRTLSSVAAHLLQHHNGRTSGIRILGLESPKTNIRGGNPTLDLLRRKSAWIHNLNSLAPGGLNEELLFTGFYKQR
ncbi:uncharacterized protein ACNLHF_021773 [Anomaloglossus baeobatrachus]|uniref:uncharacterized protein LOC142310430 n=1 Tax=Anomaloglossus baeobatrachus TaxID=238106 RepID=UPI003F50A2DA